MVERIRPLIDRYPEYDQVVLDLLERNGLFVTLCQEYSELNDQLTRLEKGDGKYLHLQSETKGLRNWRQAVEEEILTLIEGCCPV